MNAQLQETRAEITQWTERYSELEQTLQELQRQQSDLQQSFEETQSQLYAFKAECASQLQSHTNVVAQLQAQIQVLQGENELYAENVLERDRELATIHATYADKISAIESGHAEAVETLEQSIKELHAELDSTTQMKTQQTSANAELTHLSAQRQTELQQVQHQNASLTSQVASTTSQLRDTEQRLSAAKESARALQDQLMLVQA